MKKKLIIFLITILITLIILISGCIDKTQKIFSEKDAQQIAENYVKSSNSYLSYNGNELKCDSTTKKECDECYELTYTYNIKTDKLPEEVKGYQIEIVLDERNINSEKITEIRDLEKKIEPKNFLECKNMGFEIIEKRPKECVTTQGNIFQEQATKESCKDLCGDNICEEITCDSVGCPCPETKGTCSKDCK